MTERFIVRFKVGDSLIHSKHRYTVSAKDKPQAIQQAMNRFINKPGWMIKPTRDDFVSIRAMRRR